MKKQINFGSQNENIASGVFVCGDRGHKQNVKDAFAGNSRRYFMFLCSELCHTLKKIKLSFWEVLTGLFQRCEHLLNNNHNRNTKAGNSQVSENRRSLILTVNLVEHFWLLLFVTPRNNMLLCNCLLRLLDCEAQKRTVSESNSCNWHAYFQIFLK